MIDWASVAAFTGPLIGSMGGLASWFAWSANRRDKRVTDQINGVASKFDLRITQVETALANQGKHLDEQDRALSTAMQAIARIEGRLAGPIQITTATGGP